MTAVSPIPGVFNLRVVPRAAGNVAEAAEKSGIARRPRGDS